MSTSPHATEQSPFQKTISNHKGSNQLIEQINSAKKQIEAQYLYTPTQYLISNFLTTKKTIEDDLIQTLKGITEMRSKPDNSAKQLRDQLHMKKKQLQGIKRKLNKSCEQQTKVYDIMRKRIHRHQSNSVNNRVKIEEFQVKKSHEETQHNHSVDQTQKDDKILSKTSASWINNRKIFDLNLNKEITFFMVEESVKMEQKLQAQEQKRKKKQIQDKKMKEQCYNLMGNFPEQKNHVKSELSLQPHNDYQPLIEIEDGKFRLNQQKSQSSGDLGEMRMIQDEDHLINGEDDLLDLERFFESEHFQMDYISSLRGIGKTMEEMERKLNQKVEQEKIQSREELWCTKNQLFKQEEYVQKLDKAVKYLEENKMDLEQECLQESIQNENENQINHKDQSLHSFFEGQLELECMLYRKKQQISNDILSNSLDSVNHFLYENSHMIKKYESNLEFWVVICKAIELIKTKNEDKEMEAIEIMRNKLLKMKGGIQDWHRQELQKVTNMLLMGNFSIAAKPYLEKTEAAFRNVFQQIYRLPDFSRFLHSLYTGALILKTPTCIQKDKQNPLICPLCNPLAQKVFKGIPLLTRNQSNLICRVDGSVMDHENYPMMLPSNQIYSLKGLESTKKVVRPNVGKQIQQYYCKFTSTWYNKDQAKKVYLA